MNYAPKPDSKTQSDSYNKAEVAYILSCLHPTNSSLLPLPTYFTHRILQIFGSIFPHKPHTHSQIGTAS